MSFKLSLSYFSDTADQIKCAARIGWAFIRNIIIFEWFLDIANIMKILADNFSLLHNTNRFAAVNTSIQCNKLLLVNLFPACC